MSEYIVALRDRMHDCAAEAGAAVSRFGKGSIQHDALCAIFSDAAKAYEKACQDAGREPYAAYCED